MFAQMMQPPAAGFDVMDPANVAPLVVWLGSRASRHVTGRVFELQGGALRLYQGHRPGPQVDRGARWEPEALGPVVDGLLAQASPELAVYGS